MANNFPVTTGIRFLRNKKVDFEQFIYDYQEKGGTKQTSVELNIDEHNTIKTLVFADDSGKGIICLMHGDKEVSTKELARTIGVKTLSPASQAQAMKWTGYQFGGTSPFGTKTQMPIYAEKSIFELDKIYINGGKRGFILSMEASALKNVFDIYEVNVGID
jgi:Cys-tRNA(Pro) deacylase